MLLREMFYPRAFILTRKEKLNFRFSWICSENLKSIIFGVIIWRKMYLFILFRNELISIKIHQTSNIFKCKYFFFSVMWLKAWCRKVWLRCLITDRTTRIDRRFMMSFSRRNKRRRKVIKVCTAKRFRNIELTTWLKLVFRH